MMCDLPLLMIPTKKRQNGSTKGSQSQWCLKIELHVRIQEYISPPGAPGAWIDRYIIASLLQDKENLPKKRCQEKKYEC